VKVGVHILMAWVIGVGLVTEWQVAQRGTRRTTSEMLHAAFLLLAIGGWIIPTSIVKKLVKSRRGPGSSGAAGGSHPPE
jgi:hypothetical protein